MVATAPPPFLPSSQPPSQPPLQPPSLPLSRPSPVDDLAARALIAALDAQAVRHDVEFAPGRSMRWRRFGRGGDSLVLLHGGHGSWLHWVRNIEALSRGRTLWVPDLPGYGDSDAAPPPAGLDGVVEAVLAAMSRLPGLGGVGEGEGEGDSPRNAPRFDLAGFSFGGVVAARIAQGHPGVHRLALVGTAGHGLPGRARLPMLDWQRAPDAAARDAALRNNLAALMLDAPGAIDALALAVHRASCERTRFVSKAISRRRLVADALAAFEGPVLLLWGEADVTGDPAEVAPVLVQDRPSRRWHVVPGAGHWVQYERADAVDALLGDWFAPGA